MTNTPPLSTLAAAVSLLLVAYSLGHRRRRRRSDSLSDIAQEFPRIPSSLLAFLTQSFSPSDKTLNILVVQERSSWYARELARQFPKARVVCVNPNARSSAAEAQRSREQGLGVIHIRATSEEYAFDARDAVEGAGYRLAVVDLPSPLSPPVLDFCHRALEPISGVAVVVSGAADDAPMVEAGFVVERRDGPVDVRALQRTQVRALIAAHAPLPRGWARPPAEATVWCYALRRNRARSESKQTGPKVGGDAPTNN